MKRRGGRGLCTGMGVALLALGTYGCAASQNKPADAQQETPEQAPASEPAAADAPGLASEGSAPKQATGADDAESALKRKPSAEAEAYAPAPPAASGARGEALPAESSPATPSQSLAALEGRQVGAAQTLDAELTAQQLSCSGADNHRGVICSIAEEICTLTAQSPSVSSATTRCQQARERCRQATSKVNARCR